MKAEQRKLVSLVRQFLTGQNNLPNKSALMAAFLQANDIKKNMREVSKLDGYFLEAAWTYKDPGFYNWRNMKMHQIDKEKTIRNWSTDKTMNYHKQQFIEPKRSTVALEKFLAARTEIKGNILDLACGGGAVDAYFAKLHPEVKIKGIDMVDKAFWMLEEFADDEIKKRVSLEAGDWYNLDKKYVNMFDGVITVQALSWLEDWKIPLEKIIELNPKWIGLSSLFYEGRIEFQVKVTDYEGSYKTEAYYNVYSLPIVKEFLRERGYDVFEYIPFEIDIDLPKPDHRDLGTYTVKTEDGKRLQISAAMLMPWYFIYAAKS